MNIKSSRLSILSAEEIDDLYGLPRFTEDDRHLYFDLSATGREVVAAVHTLSVAVHLTLHLGTSKPSGNSSSTTKVLSLRTCITS
ncbi:MAG: hypothetical protein NTX45_25145 [Proteobacteria bacterium]|nr:hypothetical protein [Pseudomonadota bacterium]